ncbi:hypothetical protein [Curtobacterium sp. MCBD17_030]|uniref:hypothetical protein n=1 Tax=Curtobacterium sp. MCBD17_030 TaxID=2175649 RepID=UPI0015E883E3|nr:hypothetical protein [Curtobacterium sp. MCBD17_030]
MTLEQTLTSWYTDEARGTHLDFDDLPSLVKRIEAHYASVQPPTREQIAHLPDDARMEAYYYDFEHTGVGFIDAILSAVAIAGKGSHHTQSWGDENEDGYYRERPGLPDADSAVDLIQKAAQQAADAVLALFPQPGPSAEQPVTDRVERELEYRVRTAIARWEAADHDGRDTSAVVNEEVRGGRAAVRAYLAPSPRTAEPVSIAAIHAAYAEFQSTHDLHELARAVGNILGAADE